MQNKTLYFFTTVKQNKNRNISASHLIIIIILALGCLILNIRLPNRYPLASVRRGRNQVMRPSCWWSTYATYLTYPQSPFENFLVPMQCNRKTLPASTTLTLEEKLALACFETFFRLNTILCLK